MKKNNKKGFTLAELLIVIAIIAVLVAIAIPVFTSAIDDAKKAADDANIRAAYAEYQVNVLEYSAGIDATEPTKEYPDTYPELQYYEEVDFSKEPWEGKTGN